MIFDLTESSYTRLTTHLLLLLQNRPLPCFVAPGVSHFLAQYLVHNVLTHAVRSLCEVWPSFYTIHMTLFVCRQLWYASFAVHDVLVHIGESLQAVKLWVITL